MSDAQVVPGELRTTEDGRMVLVAVIEGQERVFDVVLDDDGNPERPPCPVEHVFDEDGHETVNIYANCVSIAPRPEPPSAGTLKLLEGDGTDG